MSSLQKKEYEWNEKNEKWRPSNNLMDEVWSKSTFKTRDCERKDNLVIFPPTLFFSTLICRICHFHLDLFRFNYK